MGCHRRERSISESFVTPHRRIDCTNSYSEMRTVKRCERKRKEEGKENEKEKRKKRKTAERTS